MMNIQQIMKLMSNPQFKYLLNCKNPMQAAQTLLSQNPELQNNEIFQNAIKMMNSGDTKGIETLGRNLIKNSGGDPDEVYQMFNKLK